MKAGKREERREEGSERKVVGPPRNDTDQKGEGKKRRDGKGSFQVSPVGNNRNRKCKVQVTWEG